VARERKSTPVSDLFRSAVTATPAAIGVGVFFRNMRNAPAATKFTSMASNRAPNPLNSAIQAAVQETIQSGSLTRKGRIAQLESMYDRFIEQDKMSVSKDVVVDSWKNALRTAGVGVDVEEELVFRVASKAGDAADVLKDIATIGNESSSIYTQRAISTFMEDMGILERRGLEGLNTQMMDTGLSGGFLAKEVRSLPKVSLSSLDPVTASYLKKISGAFGASIDVMRVSRSDLPGAQLHVGFAGGKLPRSFINKAGQTEFPLLLKIPEATGTGVVYKGATQQSKYITGLYGIVGKGNKLESTMNYEQFMAMRAYEDIVPHLMNDKRITRSRIRAAQSQFDQRLIGAAEWVENMPTGVNPSLDEYIAMRSSNLHLFRPGGGTFGPRGLQLPELEEEAYSQILASQKLSGPGGTFNVYPGASPAAIAKNVMMTQDPRQRYLVPEAYAFERRPMQSFRKATLTPEAQRLVGNANLTQKRFGWASMGPGNAPMFETTYVSERYAQEMAEIGMGSQGALLMSEETAGMRSFTRPKQYHIQPTNVDPTLGKLIEGKTSIENLNMPITKGQFLGRDIEGKLVEASRGGRIVSSRAFSDPLKGDYLELMVAEEFRNPFVSKVFGGAKGMAMSVKGSDLQNYIAEKFGNEWLAGQGIDAIVSMGELKKNRALHYHQLFTSLWDYIDITKNSGKQFGSGLTSRFVSEPVKALEEIRQSASFLTRGGGFSHEEMIKSALSMAREAELGPREMGAVFGAVPDVFGMETGEAGVIAGFKSKFGVTLNPFEAREVSRGLAGGIGQYFVEDLYAPGSGNTATIEPRFYELLDAPHWGEMGTAIKGDLAGRMLRSNENRVLENSVFGKAAGSFFAPSQIPGAILPSAVTEGLTEKGFGLHLPGIGDVQMPASGQFASFAKYRTPGGDMVSSDLQYSAEDFLEQAKRYEGGTLSKAGMLEETERLGVKFTEAAVSSITGPGGILRGRIPGSTFLTAVPASYGSYAHIGEGEAGITSTYAEKMWGDLEKMYADSPGEVASIRARKEKWLASKGAMAEPMLHFRHPGIGQHSMQAVATRWIPGDEAVVAYNEAERRSLIAPGRLTAEQIANVQGRASRGSIGQILRSKLGLEEATLRYSPMVGMAMDTDADLAAVIAMRPTIADKLGKQLTYETDEYTTHALRSQMLKAKAGAGTPLTLAQAMAEDAMKLGIPQRGRLGRASVSLQAGRAAVLSQQKSLGASRTANALAFLEAAEQLPISSKWIAPGQAAKQIDILDALPQAFEKGGKEGARALAEGFEAALPGMSPAKRAVLTQGVTVMTPGKEARYIEALRPGQAATDIMSAFEPWANEEIEGVSQKRLREIMFRRGTPSRSEAEALLSRGINKTALGAFMAPQEFARTGKTTSRISQGILGLKNKMGAAGRSMIPFAKPLALGFAASIALSSMLSKPPLTVDPEALASPRPYLKSGSGGGDQPTNIHPEGHISGSPTTPPSIPSGKAYITSGANIRIQGRSTGGFHFGNAGSQLGQAAGGARVHSTVSDRRQSLSPQHISHILKNR
jgi:hypothetical protein